MFKKILLSFAFIPSMITGSNVSSEKLEELANKYRAHLQEENEAATNLCTCSGLLTLGMTLNAASFIAQKSDHSALGNGLWVISGLFIAAACYSNYKLCKYLLMPNHPEPILDDNTKLQILLHLKTAKKKGR